jgi:3-oxoadipate enol-lactonase
MARLRYDEHGRRSAPVLVLSPSLGASPDMWDPQLPAFAERFHVLRLAHRGHDPIDVPPGPYTMDDLGGDIVALLDELGVERFSFCGLSLGGMLGMWLAVNAGDRVDRLALCCTAAHLPPASNWLDRAATVRASGMAAVADPVVARWFTAGFAAEHPDVPERCRQMLLAVPPEGYAGCCEAVADLDLREQLPSISAPTLVLAAAEDQSTPVEHAELIADRVPDARLEVIAGVAHVATMQDPATTTALLLNHLTRA